jgi:hypothetical protein
MVEPYNQLFQIQIQKIDLSIQSIGDDTGSYSMELGSGPEKLLFATSTDVRPPNVLNMIDGIVP